MNLKRLFRLAAFSGLVAAAVAAFRALTRDQDPLPAPAGGPSDPWPPLRTTVEAPTAAAVAVEPEPDPEPVEPATLATVVEEVEEVDEAEQPAADDEPEEQPAVVEADSEVAAADSADWRADDEWADDGAVDANAQLADDAEAAPEAKPAKKAAARRRRKPLRAPWMPPNEDGSCPEGYPLKANDQSKIFHAPGQMSYDRTVPERCYADPEVAVADGYRAAKR